MEVKEKVIQILRNFYVKNILWALATVIVLVIAVLIWMNIFTLHNESITVPDLRGMTIEKVSQILQNKNLRFEIVDSVFVKGKVPGSVVEQIPAPESNVKEGRIVFLSINAINAKKIPVPDVRDQSSRQAIATLTSMGFDVVRTVEVHSEYKDLVVEVIYNGRKVLPGQRVPMGSGLILNVGDGNAPMNSDSTKDVEAIDHEGESWF